MKRFFVVYLALATGLYAATWHLDATGGSDATGDGSIGSPWQTINHVKDTMSAGDTVFLHEGTYAGYDDFNQSGPDQSGWIVFMPYGDDSVVIDTCRTGHWNGDLMLKKYLWFRDVTFIGPFTTLSVHHFRFTNVRALDGFDFGGSNHVTVESSYVARYGPYIGNTGMGKFAIFANGTDITLQDLEITEMAGGMECRGESLNVLRNHIHDGTHDGIRIMGVRHGLFEGNRIHGFDDGVDDSDTVLYYDGDTIAVDGWNRHCDGIHIFIRGGACDVIVPNYDVTVRGNVIYDFESQGIQINNYYACDLRNAKLLFENNIFGPSSDNTVNMADPADTVVFRNNTFVYMPEGRYFVTPFRTMHLTNQTFRISSTYTEVYVYNNILVDTWNGNTVVNDWNLFRSNTQNRGIGRFSIIDTSEQFSDPESLDGKLLPTSPAIDAGTRRFAPTAICEYDFYGTARDDRPDIGAYEEPGNDPDPEPEPTWDDGPKNVFVDDFIDNDFKVDPWLDSVGVQGMSWTQDTADGGDYSLYNNTTMGATAVCAPSDTTPTWIYSDQGMDWLEYDLRFEAFNAYLTYGDGPLVLCQDKDNAYWVEIGYGQGRIWRILDGVWTVLDSSEAIEMPRWGLQSYGISVNSDANGITIAVDTDCNDTADLTVTDTDPSAISVFSAGGGIGLYRHHGNKYYKLSYGGFRVEVERFVPTGIGQPVLQPVKTPLSRIVANANPFRIGRPVVFTGETGPVTVYDRAGGVVFSSGWGNDIHQPRPARLRQGYAGEQGRGTVGSPIQWNTTSMEPGMYYVRSGNTVQKLIMVR